MPHRLDADAVPGAFGGLENGIFLLDFSIEGVLDLNEKKMRMVKADHYVDFPPGNIRLLAGFQSIFQKVGEDEAKIDLVDGKPGRQIDFGLEGNIFPLCQGGIVAEHTVHCLIFTEMKIRVGNFGQTAEENGGGYRAVPDGLPQWRRGGYRSGPAGEKESDFPAEALRFGLGCLP